MNLFAAALLGSLFVMLQPPQPAEALSGYCAKRCIPVQSACLRRNPDAIGMCRARHRACAYRCMGIR